MSAPRLSPTMATRLGGNSRRSRAIRKSGGSGLPTTTGSTPPAATATALTIAPHPGRNSPPSTGSRGSTFGVTSRPVAAAARAATVRRSYVRSKSLPTATTVAARQSLKSTMAWPAPAIASSISRAPMTSTRERLQRSMMTSPMISSGLRACWATVTPRACNRSRRSAPVRRAHRPRLGGIVEQGANGGGELVGSRRRKQDARLTALDHLDDTADRRGDDRRPARHRLEVDEAERLVDRRTDEDGGVTVKLDDLIDRYHPVDPVHVGMARHRATQTLLDLGRVGRRRAEHDLDAVRETGRGGQQVEDPLLVGDAPDEQHVGRPDAERGQRVLHVGTLEAIGIDAG